LWCSQEEWEAGGATCMGVDVIDFYKVL